MFRISCLASLLIPLAIMGCAPGDSGVWTPQPDPELASVVPVSHSVTAEDLSSPSVGGCSGTVSDESGRPMAGAQIELKRLLGMEYAGPVAVSSEDGQFGFLDVPPGQFTLDISDGVSVRSQGVAVDPAFVSQITVGQTLPDPTDDDNTQTTLTPGFGALASLLPAQGDVATFERSVVEGNGTAGVVIVTYTEVDVETGTLSFARQMGESTETVSQAFAVLNGVVYIISETVNDSVTTYTSGLPVHHDASSGAALPRDVRGSTVVGDNSVPVHDRVVLTALAAADLPLAGTDYSTQVFELYRTELATTAPRAVVTTAHYAPGAWLVQSETDVTGGDFDTVRGAVLEQLTAYVPAS